MTNQKTLACLALAMLIAGSAQAQTYAPQAELELAATGDAFQVGSQRFRVAPAAVPAPVSAATDPAKTVVVAGYEVKLQAPAAANARSKRDLSAQAPAPVAAGGAVAVAVADDGGDPVLVMPRLNVYVDDQTVAAALAGRTGGTVTYSSALGGNAVIEYASVDAALAAMKRIQGQAGVKEVAPEIVQNEIMTR
ncbi:hypothetical protein SAMN04487939_10183 [Lysobacter sp. yr284]|uniref:hypothetical protein n=1 Tax=Lysobacter sp. yr284 TaxID=1761791 RepID=UPI00089D8951|nr:hypothetical protein [Lysobacter sp. yr284]SDY17594.1 hypothetical protein SAMN04487939_10183 [Lysobacter sp. yr284]